MTQNRKQKIQAAQDQAAIMVDRCVAMLLSRDRDAGWTGTHPLGAHFDFKGFRPDSSGFSGFSKVWEQTAMLRDWPDRYLRARELLAKLRPSQREAVLIDRLYRNTWRRGDEGIVKYTASEIAQESGLSEAAFRQRVSRGYRRLMLLVAPELSAKADGSTPDG